MVSAPRSGTLVFAFAVAILAMPACTQSPSILKHAGMVAPLGGHRNWINRVQPNDSSPLRHDEQRFIRANWAGYGAIYRAVVPDSALRTIRIGDTVVAARVEVSGGASSDPIFKQGYSCVHLTKTATGYHASVATEASGRCADDVYRNDLPVATVELAEEFSQPTRVARWQQRTAGSPMILGVACEERLWCWVGITQEDVGNVSEFDPERPAGAAPGFYDEQYLSILHPTNSDSLLPSRMRARVVPAPNLDSLLERDFLNTWVHVATVIVDRGDRSLTRSGRQQYKRRWKLEWPWWFFKVDRGIDPGERFLVELRLVADSTTTIGFSWQGRYRQPRNLTDVSSLTVGKSAELQVGYEGPKPDINRVSILMDAPPGSVRWGWHDDDERIWVRCAAGCCELSFALY